MLLAFDLLAAQLRVCAAFLFTLTLLYKVLDNNSKPSYALVCVRLSPVPEDFAKAPASART